MNTLQHQAFVCKPSSDIGLPNYLGSQHLQCTLAAHLPAGCLKNSPQLLDAVLSCDTGGQLGRQCSSSSKIVTALCSPQCLRWRMAAGLLAEVTCPAVHCIHSDWKLYAMPTNRAHSCSDCILCLQGWQAPAIRSVADVNTCSCCLLMAWQVWLTCTITLTLTGHPPSCAPHVRLSWHAHVLKPFILPVAGESGAVMEDPQLNPSCWHCRGGGPGGHPVV